MSHSFAEDGIGHLLGQRQREWALCFRCGEMPKAGSRLRRHRNVVLGPQSGFASLVLGSCLPSLRHPGPASRAPRFPSLAENYDRPTGCDGFYCSRGPVPGPG